MRARTAIAEPTAHQAYSKLAEISADDSLPNATYPMNATRKMQLLELCARIGFTPPHAVWPDLVIRLEASLEATPCHKNMRS